MITHNMITTRAGKQTSARDLRSRLDRLRGQRQAWIVRQDQLRERLVELEEFLGLADDVTSALDQLGREVFDRQLRVIESTLTKALQEVLEQPIRLRAISEFKRETASVEFVIEREDGHQEDIMRGQGGSVANILSVGLRLFAITTLDPKSHRRFLVLDEQDCWLHPKLVPNLVRIVQQTGRALGFQVLMISHHDVNTFIRYADRVYRLIPDRGEGVGIELIRPQGEPAPGCPAE